MDNKSGVSVTITDTRTVPLYESGIYEELLLSNGLGYDIYLIGMNNNRTILKADINNSSGCISIYKRTTNDPRSDKANGFNQQKACKQVTTTISPSCLAEGQFFHPDTNLVYATMDIGNSVSHPNSVKAYDKVVKDAITTITNIESTSIEFAANDPLGRTNAVYGCVGGYCFKVTCTKVPTEKPTGTFTTFIATGNDVIQQSVNDISELSQDGSMVITVLDKLLCLGITATEALARYNKEADSTNLHINAMVDTRLDGRRIEVEAMLDNLRSEHQIKVAELTTAISEGKSKIKLCGVEISRLKSDIIGKDNLIATWESSQSAYAKRFNHDAAMRSDNMKYYEQYHKTSRAEMSTRSEAIKIWSSVAAVIIAAIVGAVLKAQMDKK